VVRFSIVLWPLAYALLAFLMTLLGGGLYNVVAHFVGGVELVTEEVKMEVEGAIRCAHGRAFWPC
jgi:hypothetical protein